MTGSTKGTTGAAENPYTQKVQQQQQKQRPRSEEGARAFESRN